MLVDRIAERTWGASGLSSWMDPVRNGLVLVTGSVKVATGIYINTANKAVCQCDGVACEGCSSPVQPEQGCPEHDQAPPDHQSLLVLCTAGTSEHPHLLHCRPQS